MFTHKSLAGLLGAVMLLATMGEAKAEVWTITRLTNNNTIDSAPSLYNGTIAWKDFDHGTIQYWDGSSIRTIGVGLHGPSLYNGTIAWDDSGGEIYSWNGNSTVKITSDTGNYFPSLYNGTIAFTYHQDSPTKTDEIRYWDGATIRTVATGGFNTFLGASLYNGTIAWCAMEPNYDTIYYWDGNSTTQVTHGFGTSLYAGAIAFEGGGIKYWDGSSITQVATGFALANPSLYNGTIAWQGYDGQHWQIYYWDGMAVTQVTDNNMNNSNPSLFGNTIAWQADGEIYYATRSPSVVPEPSALVVWTSLGGVGLGLAWRGRKRPAKEACVSVG